VCSNKYNSSDIISFHFFSKEKEEFKVSRINKFGICEMVGRIVGLGFSFENGIWNENINI
jgi:uncharacterized protein YcsI (UPF0317 family)